MKHKEEQNQCDGCQRGLPTTEVVQYGGDSQIWHTEGTQQIMRCTKERYQEEKKCSREKDSTLCQCCGLINMGEQQCRGCGAEAYKKMYPTPSQEVSEWDWEKEFDKEFDNKNLTLTIKLEDNTKSEISAEKSIKDFIRKVRNQTLEAAAEGIIEDIKSMEHYDGCAEKDCTMSAEEALKEVVEMIERGIKK